MLRRPPRSPLFPHPTLFQSRADGREALLPRGCDVEHPGADRAAQPLLARRGVEGAAERAHVERDRARALRAVEQQRSEEHMSELQSRQYLVCRLLLEQKITS